MNFNELKDAFNKQSGIAKGAEIGAGVVIAVGLTPILPLTVPFIALGAGVGAAYGYFKNKM